MSKPSLQETIPALLVHALTASGALCALFSLQAIFLDRPDVCLLWLILALVIDGVDGPLARRFEVKTRVPYINGELLDLIVDFLTYVFVPVVFIWFYDLLPGAAELVLLGAILLSSLYLFTYTEMKESDNFFNGFPAAWNLVLIAWFILETPQLLNAAMVVVFAVLTFVPVKSVHPIRVARFHQINLAMVFLWVLLSALLVPWKDDLPQAVTWAWATSTLYFLVISLWRTVKGRDAWKKATRP